MSQDKSQSTGSYLRAKKIGSGKKAGEPMIRAGEVLYGKTTFQSHRTTTAPKMTVNRRKGDR